MHRSREIGTISLRQFTDPAQVWTQRRFGQFTDPAQVWTQRRFGCEGTKDGEDSPPMASMTKPHFAVKVRFSELVWTCLKMGLWATHLHLQEQECVP